MYVPIYVLSCVYVYVCVFEVNNNFLLITLDTPWCFQASLTGVQLLGSLWLAFYHWISSSPILCVRVCLCVFVYVVRITALDKKVSKRVVRFLHTACTKTTRHGCMHTNLFVKVHSHMKTHTPIVTPTYSTPNTDAQSLPFSSSHLVKMFFLFFSPSFKT